MELEVETIYGTEALKIVLTGRTQQRRDLGSSEMDLNYKNYLV